MSFQSLGLSQPVLQALALKEYKRRDPDPDAGHPDRPQGPRPARHRPDRHRQDRGLHAAVDRPARASPNRRAGPARLPDAGARADPRAGQPDRRERPRLRPLLAACAVATVFGGTSIGKNRQDVARGVDILVATPGRLIDLIEQRYLTLREVEILVLDEADQMLDLGFIHALKQIVRLLPAKRQTLFFSATMPKAIKELADKFLTDPAAGLGRARRDHGRAGRAICHLRPAGREAGAADHDAAPRLFRARQYGPRADLHPHQAWRRPGREAARRQRHRRQRDPRQQEPAAARARAGRVQGRPGRRSWSRPTSPRAASTSRASAT